MKHWARRIVIGLLLGVVTTVGVAWGCRVLSPITKRETRFTRQGDEIRASQMNVRIGHDIVVNLADRYATPDIQQLEAEYRAKQVVLPGSWRSPATFEATIAGWPAPALYGERWRWPLARFDEATLSRKPPSDSERIGYMYALPVPVRIERDWLPLRSAGLPLCPVWPGFLIDTLFYGMIWFGLLFGYTSVRRALRCRLGRCPHCGYDLHGHIGGRGGADRRPECGAAVKQP
jgi:hypothetical protein